MASIHLPNTVSACEDLMRLFFSLCLMFAPAVAHADACGPRLVATFSEGAPADRFTLTNTSDPGWSVTEVEIDLGPSRGRVIFDVTERGAGLSVYQPFEEATGTAVIANRSEVTDGDTLLTLRFSRFAPGDTFGFTIDLDDTAGFAPTVVSTDEIAEASSAPASPLPGARPPARASSTTTAKPIPAGWKGVSCRDGRGPTAPPVVPVVPGPRRTAGSPPPRSTGRRACPIAARRTGRAPPPAPRSAPPEPPSLPA